MLRLILLLLCVGCASAATPTVTLTTSAPAPAVGDTFTITLALGNAGTFQSWNAFLRFDPARVELVAHSAGDLGSFVADSTGLVAINQTGEIHAGGTAFSAITAGNGVLARFSFRALRAGTTRIESAGLTADNPFGNQLIAPDGTVTIPALDSPVDLVIDNEIQIDGRRITIAVNGLEVLWKPDIDPQAGQVSQVANGYRFSGLSLTQTYVFSWLPIHNN